MLLCDIGNSSYHFYDGVKEEKYFIEDFKPSEFKERVFYICVNPHVKTKLELLDNWIDLSLDVAMQNYYPTMGIDRVIACEAISDGVVVDAGSAITVDIVKDGVFMGGWIALGLHQLQKSYSEISSKLSYQFNYNLNFDIMPKNSQDAITYGALKPLCSEILSYGLPITLTGGDATKLAPFLEGAIVDELLLFKGMKKIIQRADLC